MNVRGIVLFLVLMHRLTRVEDRDVLFSRLMNEFTRTEKQDHVIFKTETWAK